MPQNIKIMMVGPAMDAKGGVTQVVNDYYQGGLFQKFHISYFATYREGSKLLKVRFFLGSFRRIIKQISHFALVHIHTSYGWSFRRLILIGFLAKMLNKVVIFHIHGSRFEQFYFDTSTFEKWMISGSLRRADCVIVLSREWKKKVLNISPKAKIVVIKNAINLERAAMPKRTGGLETPYRILFLGRLGERKGVYDIIRAANLLPKDDYKIVLAGDGEIEEVQSYVKGEGLQHMFVLPGWVSGNEKERLLEKAHLFLLPSYFEGLPISILEAMAFSLPIVATPVGGIPQVVKHNENGYLVPCGDPTTLAHYIKKVFVDPGAWRKFSNRSRTIVEELCDQADCKCAVWSYD